MLGAQNMDATAVADGRPTSPPRPESPPPTAAAITYPGENGYYPSQYNGSLSRMTSMPEMGTNTNSLGRAGAYAGISNRPSSPSNNRPSSPVVFEYEKLAHRSYARPASPTPLPSGNNPYARPLSPTSTQHGGNLSLGVAAALVGGTSAHPRTYVKPDFATLVQQMVTTTDAATGRQVTRPVSPTLRAAPGARPISPTSETPTLSRAMSPPPPPQIQVSGFSMAPQPSFDKSLPPIPTYAEKNRAGGLRAFWRALAGKHAAHTVAAQHAAKQAKIGVASANANAGTMARQVPMSPVLGPTTTLVRMSSTETLGGLDTTGSIAGPGVVQVAHQASAGGSSTTVNEITSRYIKELSARLEQLAGVAGSELEVQRCQQALDAIKAVASGWEAVA